jgi:hypothetical protein
LASVVLGPGETASLIRRLRDRSASFVRLSLSQFLVVIGAAFAVPVPGLGDGGHVGRVVDAPVAAQ